MQLLNPKTTRIIIFITFCSILSSIAFSLEKNIPIEKRTVITDLYPDIPQYPDEYFFVGSHYEDTIPVKSRALLRFSLNEFTNKEIKEK